MRRWVHPEKARYYQADLVVDLLGDWNLVTAWGGLGSHLGRVRRVMVASQDEGVRRLGGDREAAPAAGLPGRLGWGG